MSDRDYSNCVYCWTMTQHYVWTHASHCAHVCLKCSLFRGLEIAAP